MRKVLLLSCFLTLLSGAAPPRTTVPAQFQGHWAREGGQCTDGNAQMEGMLAVLPRQIVHGEVIMDVAAVRRVSTVSIAADTRNDVEIGPVWTSTTLLTLSMRGQRLVFEQTRKNGTRLREAIPEMYRRCP